MSTPPPIELFRCEIYDARLSVRACGARFLKVRAATKGSADYAAGCDGCPIGAHHAYTGTLCPDVTTQTPAATAPTTTTKETTMAAKSEYTDDQKRDAAKRVILKSEVPEAVGKELGVSGTTVRNWVKRFGLDLAGDAMDAAAGKEPKAKVAKATKLERAAKAFAAPKQKRATLPLSEAVSVDFHPAEAAHRPRGASVPAPAIDPSEAARVSMELGDAVRHIADKRARTAVADAAWMLSQVAHG